MMRPVNCQHHRPGRVIGGGVCAINHHRNPSFGVCRHCRMRQPIEGWDGPADGILLTGLTIGGKSVASSDLSIVGPRLWAELHRYALSLSGPIDREAERAWLAAFRLRIPCGDCRRHWDQIVAATPPDLSSAAAMFAWTVARHNEINARLAKPQMTEEAARRHWLEAAS